MEPESVKLAEGPVYHPGPRPVLRPRKSQSAVKHSMTEAEEHSLQVVVQKFEKIHELKILNLKWSYSANATLFSTAESLQQCYTNHPVVVVSVICFVCGICVIVDRC